MRTIPLMCTVCGEIVDAIIPLGEAGPGGCPMCGGELTSDYDLPPDEHVTIEFHTPERLRIRCPLSVKPFPLADKFAILVTNAICLFPLGVSLNDCFLPHRPSRIGDFVFSAVLFIVISTPLNLTALVNRWGHRVIEVDQDKLDILTTLGSWSWTRMIRLTKVRTIAYAVTNAKFNLPPPDMRQGGCSLVFRNGNHFSLLPPSPDRPRYVTHLLRRQLCALGHELSDTSDKSAKRPGDKRSALEPVHGLR